MSEIRTVTCPCISDTFVRRHELIQNFFSAGIDTWVEGENENHGSADRLTFGFVFDQTGIPQVQQTSTTQDHRAIVQFDLSEAMVMGNIRSAKLQLFVPSGEGWWGSMLQITPTTISGSVIVEDSFVFSRWNQAIRLEDMPMRSVEVNTGAFQVPNPDWIPPFMPEHDPDIPPLIWVETSQTVERGADWVTPERQITPNGGEFDVTHLFDRGLVQQNVLTFALMSLGPSNQLITPTRTGSQRSNILTTRFSRESGRNTAPRLILECEPRLGIAPSNLAPTTTQNPRTPIRISWRHERHPSIPSGLVDPQIDSEVEFWQGNGVRIIVNGGLENSVELEVNTFTSFANVSFRARTRTEYNDWGVWSAVQIFPLALDPPLAPTDLTPSEPRNPNRDIELRWRHNRNPSRMGDIQTGAEVRARQGTTGGWVYIVTDTSNRAIIFSNTFSSATSIQWQVRTETALGDWGVWSEIQTFSTFTAPPIAPTNLTPTTTQNPLEWDLQVNSELEINWGNASTGIRTEIIQAGTLNRVELPADMFVTEPLTTVSFRVRTESQANGWGAWSTMQSFDLATNPPLAPTNLQPTTMQNRRVAIAISWNHAPNPTMLDSQIDSQVEVWQGSGERLVLSGGTANRVVLSADTFTTNTAVSYRVRTRTSINGWGEWSNPATFTLSQFPPSAPTELLPAETRNPNVDIQLSWTFRPNPSWFPNDGQTDSEIEVWQGGGARTLINGGSGNRAILPAGTFTTTVSVNMRARTFTALGGWGAWSSVYTLPLSTAPPLAPTNISPTTPQNPRGEIHASWLHTPNPEMSNDIQVDSEIRVRQGTGAWRIVNGGIMNQAVIPANFFTTFVQVEVQARTRAEINGWGGYSPSVFFTLRATPPLPPTLIQPKDTSVRGTQGAFLEWDYNSPYDIFPSRFDIRYRVDGGAWANLRNDATGGFPARVTTTTRIITAQSRVEWQVRAYGELGDMGDWSDIETFFIVGIPPTPVIVRVSNSNRPEFQFSARHVEAWELEVYRGNEIIYSTGITHFVYLSHISREFIPNGNYLARLRIQNEHEIFSEWATLAFSINTVPPQAVTLRTANNLQYYNRLLLDNPNGIAYVYRAEYENDNFVCIAKVDGVGCYDDYTCRPKQIYKYFVRTVDSSFSFADSDIKTAISDFKETTLATAESPSDMILFYGQLNRNPTKSMEFEQEKSLTKFVGRESPIVQFGEHSDTVLSLSFYCSSEDKTRLQALIKSGKTLILRDTWYGAIYGTITGGIRMDSDGYTDKAIVSFSFTKTDYDMVVDVL